MTCLPTSGVQPKELVCSDARRRPPAYFSHEVNRASGIRGRDVDHKAFLLFA